MLLKGNHMYDALVKVPLIVKWPRQRGAGGVSKRLVSNVDLAPTLCLAAGLQPAAEMHGEDLGGESQGREIVFCESGPNRAMARTRTHKLLITDNAPQQTLFYDLQSDPLELHNLSGLLETHDEIRRLTAAIATWRPQPVSQRYVDLQAPQIRGANVPSPGLEHRPQIIDYYRTKIQTIRER
jgi:arylsulfatase